ncbi:unnamed protein product [Vitrella brassicaformis CCMP3155]|uniref:Uncharacterized protein n=2 Tax=Vitrella brassicaformis TaxID=1169539 RepID=A0A0G4GQV0_VITBC|nr:unnamed protein product [Vitrella brassicaformis CCMP3155]|eukprot:CEM32827.1 unnamed protein product [Vitrella brassicaformis CCMP3155]
MAAPMDDKLELCADGCAATVTPTVGSATAVDEDSVSLTVTASQASHHGDETKETLNGETASVEGAGEERTPSSSADRLCEGPAAGACVEGEGEDGMDESEEAEVAKLSPKLLMKLDHDVDRLAKELRLFKIRVGDSLSRQRSMDVDMIDLKGSVHDTAKEQHKFEDELRRCCREVGALTDKLTSMQADMTNTKTQEESFSKARLKWQREMEIEAKELRDDLKALCVRHNEVERRQDDVMARVDRTEQRLRVLEKSYDTKTNEAFDAIWHSQEENSRATLVMEELAKMRREQADRDNKLEEQVQGLTKQLAQRDQQLAELKDQYQEMLNSTMHTHTHNHNHSDSYPAPSKHQSQQQPVQPFAEQTHHPAPPPPPAPVPYTARMLPPPPGFPPPPTNINIHTNGVAHTHMDYQHTDHHQQHHHHQQQQQQEGGWSNGMTEDGLMQLIERARLPPDQLKQLVQTTLAWRQKNSHNHNGCQQ